MSGQPCRNVRDAQKFRKAYLASLDVQIANNEKNLQANLLHKRTGQMTTQITDYRTTSQKLADATMLRIDVKRQLRRICDSPNTEQIVSQLGDDEIRFVSQNINRIVKDLQPKFRYGVPSPNFMVYLRTIMESDLKIVGAGVEIAEDLDMLGQLEILQELKKFIGNVSRLLPKEAIQEWAEKIKKFEKIIRTFGYLVANLRILTPDRAAELDEELRKDIDEFPTKEIIHQAIIESQMRANDAEALLERLDGFFRMLDLRDETAFLIKLEALLDELERADQEAIALEEELERERRGYEEALRKEAAPFGGLGGGGGGGGGESSNEEDYESPEEGSLASGETKAAERLKGAAEEPPIKGSPRKAGLIEPPTVYQATGFSNELIDNIIEPYLPDIQANGKKNLREWVDMTQKKNKKLPPDEQLPISRIAYYKYVRPTMMEIYKAGTSPTKASPSSAPQATVPRPKLKRGQPLIKLYTEAELQDLDSDAIFSSLSELENAGFSFDDIYTYLKRQKNVPNNEALVEATKLSNVRDYYLYTIRELDKYDQMKGVVEGKGLKTGKGYGFGGNEGGSSSLGGKTPARSLHTPTAPHSRYTGEGVKPKRKIKGRGIGIVEGVGVHKKVIFAPFGRFFINLVKLNDDILCFSRAKGTNIPDLKTRRASQPLAIVIRKMVNGATPSFNELSALSRQDKEEYNEILRKCHIVSGEGLEIPKIDEKTDLNQFEIMKGEILSGNDSTELIKKFKVMIIKLIHNGRLPKSEGKSLLMDLAELGY
jgi:hypothetical protein